MFVVEPAKATRPNWHSEAFQAEKWAAAEEAAALEPEPDARSRDPDRSHDTTSGKVKAMRDGKAKAAWQEKHDERLRKAEKLRVEVKEKMEATYTYEDRRLQVLDVFSFNLVGRDWLFGEWDFWAYAAQAEARLFMQSAHKMP